MSERNGGYTLNDWNESSKHLYDLPYGIASEALQAARRNDGNMTREELDAWVTERLTRRTASERT